jgi:hypothetical protein
LYKGENKKRQSLKEGRSEMLFQQQRLVGVGGTLLDCIIISLAVIAIQDHYIHI